VLNQRVARTSAADLLKGDKHGYRLTNAGRDYWSILMEAMDNRAVPREQRNAGLSWRSSTLRADGITSPGCSRTATGHHPTTISLRPPRPARPSGPRWTEAGLGRSPDRSSFPRPPRASMPDGLSSRLSEPGTSPYLW